MKVSVFLLVENYFLVNILLINKQKIFMMYGYYGDWMGYSLLGGLFMFIFWVVVIIIIINLIRHGSHISHWDKSSNRAVDILKERYAKGEINKEDFEAKKKDLV